MTISSEQESQNYEKIDELIESFETDKLQNLARLVHVESVFLEYFKNHPEVEFLESRYYEGPEDRPKVNTGIGYHKDGYFLVDFSPLTLLQMMAVFETYDPYYFAQNLNKPVFYYKPEPIEDDPAESLLAAFRGKGVLPPDQLKAALFDNFYRTAMGALSLAEKSEDSNIFSRGYLSFALETARLGGFELPDERINSIQARWETAAHVNFIEGMPEIERKLNHTILVTLPNAVATQGILSAMYEVEKALQIAKKIGSDTGFAKPYAVEALDKILIKIDSGIEKFSILDLLRRFLGKDDLEGELSVISGNLHTAERYATLADINISKKIQRYRAELSVIKRFLFLKD